MNVRSEVIEVLVDFLPEALEVGSEILTQALDSGASLDAKGAQVATGAMALPHYHPGPDRAYGQGCEKFR